MVVRLGDHVEMYCATLIRDACELRFGHYLKYLVFTKMRPIIFSKKRMLCYVTLWQVYILNAALKRCRRNFYRTFNAIYYRSKRANSELILVQLF